MRVWFLLPAASLALLGCATVKALANCDQLPTWKERLAMAIEAADKYCAAPVDKPPESE
jgi:hypothetical protein